MGWKGKSSSRRSGREGYAAEPAYTATDEMWISRAPAVRAAATASRVASTFTATYCSHEARRCTRAAECTMARTPRAAACHAAGSVTSPATAAGPAGLGHEREARPPAAVAVEVGDHAPAVRGGGGRLRIEQQAADLAVHVPAEVQPRDRLLAGVAALRIRHAADRVEPYFLRDGLLVHLGAEPGPAGEDAAQL